MKPFLILTSLLIGLPAFGQSTWRNFFTTNQNPIVEVVAGSNATVQASTVGVNLRRFTVNSTASGGGQTNISWIVVTNLQSAQVPLSVITNAQNLTNWALLNTNVLSTLGQTNISYLSVTNAPWLTNLDTRQVSFRTSLEQTNAITGASVLITNGVETIIKSNYPATVSIVLDLTNSTPATVVSQQYSPALTLSGNGWKTDSTAASQSVRFRQYVLPIQGAASPTATWNLESSINGGAFGGFLSFSSGGDLNVGNTVILQAAGNILTSGEIRSGLGLQASSGNAIYWSGRSTMWSPSDGVVKLSNNSDNGFTSLILGPVSGTWPTLLTSTNASGPLIDYTGILKTSGHVIKSNSLSTWPTAPLARGDTFIGSSNGVIYALFSGTAATWTKTNLISGP